MLNPKLFLMSHFLNVLKLLWIFLTYQWFPLGFMLFVVTGCIHTERKREVSSIIETRPRIESWCTLEVLLCLLSRWSLFQSGVEPGEGGHPGPYLSVRLMRMSYVRQSSPDIKTLCRCGPIANPLAHTHPMLIFSGEEGYLFALPLKL